MIDLVKRSLAIKVSLSSTNRYLDYYIIPVCQQKWSELIYIYIYFLFFLAAADHKRKIKAKLLLLLLEILYGRIVVDWNQYLHK